MGSPAKFVRYLTDQDLEYMQDNVRNYVELANVYKILVYLLFTCQEYIGILKCLNRIFK